ncbi:hypothetical protein M885DRAFT_430909 [Pelagophyceae sp. CCMP2097]|nr:hypothetical protein M885DRAFT_430909 [Pelagophyceae sp. CCMP2097]
MFAKLARLGVQAMRPQPRLDGTKRWLRPAVSIRKQKVLRKYAVVTESFGTFSEENGGWLREWDAIPKAEAIIRPNKLHKRGRTREDRALRIDKAMADMPQKIAAYRAAREAKKPKPGIEARIKRLISRL